MGHCPASCNIGHLQRKSREDEPYSVPITIINHPCRGNIHVPHSHPTYVSSLSKTPSPKAHMFTAGTRPQQLTRRRARHRTQALSSGDKRCQADRVRSRPTSHGGAEHLRQRRKGQRAVLGWTKTRTLTPGRGRNSPPPPSMPGRTNAIADAQQTHDGRTTDAQQTHGGRTISAPALPTADADAEQVHGRKSAGGQSPDSGCRTDI